MFTKINNMTEDQGYNSPYKCFQSSLKAIAGPEPDPIFTKNPTRRRRDNNDILARIRRVIYTHYLHDDDDESDWDSDTETDYDSTTDTDNDV